MLCQFTRQRTSIATLALLLLGLVVTLGCGRSADAERVRTHPTQGQLTYDGQPIPGAFIVLHPKGASDSRVKPARASVGSDGKFIVSTYDAGDGAASGEYAVTVEWYRLVKNGDSSQPGPNVLPLRYASPQTTDLIVRVADGHNDLGVIALKR